MSVGAVIQPALYNGDGVETVFIIPWIVRNPAWISAGWADENDEWQAQVNGSDYTVALNGANWELTFNTPPPTGVNNVVIARQTPGLQSVNFKDLRRFPAQSTESMGDLLAEASQDLFAGLATCFRFAPSDFGKLKIMDPLAGAVGKFWTIVADPDNPGGFKISFSPSVAAVEATAAISDEILTLAGISDEIVIVAQPAAAANIALVAPSINSVNTVAGSIGAVGAVSGAIANINLVGGSISNVNAVAGAIGNISIVAGAIANVNLVGDDLALGAGASFILRAPQAASDAIAAKDLAETAAAATQGSASAAAGSATTAAGHAAAANAAKNDAIAYAAAAALSAGIATGQIFLPNFKAKSRSVAAQPGSPANLDTYILPASPSGAQWGSWAENDVVVFFSDAGVWARATPQAGDSGFIVDEFERVVFDGTAFDTTGVSFVAMQSFN